LASRYLENRALNAWLADGLFSALPGRLAWPNMSQREYKINENFSLSQIQRPSRQEMAFVFVQINENET
jgi:hypothetical protein